MLPEGASGVGASHRSFWEGGASPIDYLLVYLGPKAVAPPASRMRNHAEAVRYAAPANVSCSAHRSMPPVADLLLVFSAGVLTTLATGLGVAPFFIVATIRARWIVRLWGVATGVMLVMATFVAYEGIREGGPGWVALGLAAGIALMRVADHLVKGPAVFAGDLPTGPRRTRFLVVGAMFVHSIPEGVAVGVAFADLGLAADVVAGGLALPALAVSMTLAVALLNIPEGLVVAIPLVTRGVPRMHAVGWAVFTGLPQPIFAVVAYVFVTTARDLLPVGLGFAAGTLLYLILYEFTPAAREHGQDLPRGGWRELISGSLVGALTVSLLLLLLGP